MGAAAAKTIRSRATTTPKGPGSHPDEVRQQGRTAGSTQPQTDPAAGATIKRGARDRDDQDDNQTEVVTAPRSEPKSTPNRWVG